MDNSGSLTRIAIGGVYSACSQTLKTTEVWESFVINRKKRHRLFSAAYRSYVQA